MPETTEQTQTVASQFHQSEAVRSSIDSIVDDLREKQVAITDVRGPVSPESAQTFEEFQRLTAEVRGRPLFYPYVGSGIGNGPFVELMDGSVKMDLITGIGVQFFGHSDPDLVRTALNAALGDTVQQGNLQANPESVRFGEILLREAKKGSRLEHAFLTTSGAMANESAVKVCFQKHAPASRVLAFSHCFMGRSWAMSQIGDSAANRAGLPLNVLVDYMPFYDEVAARRASAGDVSGPTRYIDMCVWHLEQYIERYPNEHSCFIFELVQGEGGFNTALPDFHKALMEVCKAHRIAVWDDEIQTFGRTTEMFCYDALGLGEYVDVLCVGKLSQVCATLYTSEYNPKPGLLSGTFLGSTDTLQVGTRILERLSGGGYYGESGSIARHHGRFEQGIKALAEKHPEWFPAVEGVGGITGGFGGMMRFTPFGGKKEAIGKLCHMLFEEGIIAFYCGHGPFHVRFLPPLGVMELETWDRAFEIIESAMARTASAMGTKA